jgi:hypothetical protein
VGAVTALAAVVIAGTRSSTHGNSAQGAGTHVVTETAEARSHLVTFLLSMIANQFCCADTDQRTLRKVASMMGMIVVFTSLFADVDHAIITAVALVVPTTTGLRDRVARTELAAKATVVVIFADPAMIVVSRLPFYLGPVDNLVVRFTGMNNEGPSRCLIRVRFTRPKSVHWYSPS